MNQMGDFVSVTCSDALQLAWLTRLLDVHAPDDVAGVIVELVCAQPNCDAASVVWGLDAPGSLRGLPAVPEQPTDLAWLREAGRAALPQWTADGRRVAISLCREPQLAVLLVTVSSGAAHHVPANLLELLQWAGQQLQRALEWWQLQQSHQQLQRSDALQRALFAISDLSGSARDMPDMLRGIHDIVSTLMYAENFFIVQYNPAQDSICFLYFRDVEDPVAPGNGGDLPLAQIEHTLTWYVITTGRTFMGTAEELAAQAAGPVTRIGADSVDWLGVPMRHEGAVGGALVVQSYLQEVNFSQDDRILLEFVGSHILTALERKQSKRELEQQVSLRTQELAEANRGLQMEILERQRAERLQVALFQIAQLATADIDQAHFYRRIHAVVGELLNAENFYIGLLSDDRKSLTFPYAVDAVKLPPLSRPLGRGLSEYVLRRGSPLCADNAAIEDLERRGEIVSGRSGSPALCWLGVPLIVADEVIGLITVQSYRPSVVYRTVDEELLGFVASQVANSLMRRRSAESLRIAYEQLEHRVEERTRALRSEIAQRERVQDQLRHQVMHDSLTGLPNRGYLRDRIDRVLAGIRKDPQRRCALLYLDIDRFKIINDSLGHLAGDEVLKEVATRLGGCVRHPDLVARLAGDEFAILLEDGAHVAIASSVAQRVLDILDAPILVAGKELRATASLGIAMGDSHYQNADEILRDADIALYRAKEMGRKRYELYDERLARNVVDVLALEGELHEALKRGQFEPHFQPISRLDSGEVVGYEALIRWNHPQRGMLKPADFLKVAEDSGLIETIDWHMFELSCNLLGQHAPAGSFMTFNVSAMHLRQPNFDQQLIAMLERTGLVMSRLIAEVTEGSLLDDPHHVRGTLERLRQAGIGAALDDFGTGYSSLSYLHSLPLRMLKIDRAFVHELDHAGNTGSNTVVAAILALARALNIQVIAEGIETEGQRQALLAMGCEMGQGYLLGRPQSYRQWLSAEAD